MIWWAVAAAALVPLAAGLARLRRNHLVVTVQGRSMSPTFRHGDRVLVRRHPGEGLRTGQVVVVDLPARLRPVPIGFSPAEAQRHRRVIKRIAAVAGEPVPFLLAGAGPVVPPNYLVLLGDNPDDSGDSRQFGLVGADAVVGVVRRPLRRQSVDPPVSELRPPEQPCQWDDPHPPPGSVRWEDLHPWEAPHRTAAPGPEDPPHR
jgi:signal peptidase I